MSKILPVPHYLQLDDGYCLPACVQMVLAYWGIERKQAVIAKQLGLIPGAGVPGNRIKTLASRKLNVFYGIGDLADLRTALEHDIPYPQLYLFTPVNCHTGNSLQLTLLYYWG